MKVYILIVLVLVVSGCASIPSTEKMELSASAGRYQEVSEPIDSDGSLKFRLKLDEVRNGTSWAPGAMISFADGGYHNALIFTIYQRQQTDNFLTAAIRYSENERDVFFKNLPKQYPMNSAVELIVKWDSSSGFLFSFSDQPEMGFKPEIEVKEIYYSISSGSGTIEKI